MVAFQNSKLSLEFIPKSKSQAWKRMMVNKKEAEKGIQWRLHNGKCSFWWDNWLGSGPLALSRTEGGRPGNTSVSNFWNEGHWDLQKLNGTVPAHKISEIMQTYIYYNPDLPDKPIWMPTVRGKFSCTPSWDLIRKKKPQSFTNRRIWHKKKPLSGPFVCGEPLETNSQLMTECKSLVVQLSPGVSGNFARIIWKKYGCHVGIQTENLPLRLLLMKWWMMRACNSVQKLILDTLPIIICWNLWKNRCIVKYGAKNTSLTRVLYSINSDINLLLRSNFPGIQWPFNWGELYPFIENIQHHTTITKVKWIKPDKGFVKVNSDGSAMINPGKIGGGVIIRDQQGHFIHAMAFPLGEGTNNYAETEAARIGVQWCLDNGIPRVHLEADSALLVRWLTEDNDSPWILKEKISHLRLLCSQFEGFIASHVYREANYPADSLSKLSHDLNILTNFTTASSLPTHIRGQVLHDQLGTPAFRHKKTNILIVSYQNASSSSTSNGYG
ncbi:putative ribonuclease h protein [Nicotiana attenuata]|uniref:Ribonuclease h protein n=1 Tax=Nicotiana attenuata TaxID=49451 RepID=A0A1J6JTQ3_NICAT|nr:putative ribonuclease h protein [Nicotiana attenuata]